MPTKLLKFGLSFCRPCVMMTERFEKDPVSIPVVEYDGFEEEELVKKYDIKKFPTMIILDANDNEIFRHTGLITVEKLNLAIDELRGNKRVEQTT